MPEITVIVPRALPQDDYVVLRGASPKGVAISFLRIFQSYSKQKIAGPVPSPFGDYFVATLLAMTYNIEK